MALVGSSRLGVISGWVMDGCGDEALLNSLDGESKIQQQEAGTYGTAELRFYFAVGMTASLASSSLIIISNYLFITPFKDWIWESNGTIRLIIHFIISKDPKWAGVSLIRKISVKLTPGLPGEGQPSDLFYPSWVGESCTLVPGISHGGGDVGKVKIFPGSTMRQW